MVRRLLNLEGAAVLGAIVYIYFFRIEGSWVLFVGLLLAPDVGLAAYAAGKIALGRSVTTLSTRTSYRCRSLFPGSRLEVKSLWRSD